MTRHGPWSFRSGPGWLAGCLLRPGLGLAGVTQQRWPAGWRALSPPKTRLGPGGLQRTVTKLTVLLFLPMYIRPKYRPHFLQSTISCCCRFAASPTAAIVTPPSQAPFLFFNEPAELQLAFVTVMLASSFVRVVCCPLPTDVLVSLCRCLFSRPSIIALFVNRSIILAFSPT